MKFGVEYLAVLFLRGDVVAIDMRADGYTCYSIFFLNLFRCVPFGQGIVSPVLGECRIDVLFAVIVELADFDFGNLMLPSISSYPFSIDFILFRYFFSGIVFTHVKIVFRNYSLIRFCL